MFAIDVLVRADMGIEVHRNKVDALRVERLAAKQAFIRERSALVEAENHMDACEEALEAVRTIGRALQQKAHEKISEAVSSCLRAVFSDPYEFRVEFEEKRGRTEAVLVMTKDGEDFRDPLNEVGGGVTDIVALALRAAEITLAKPPKRRFLVLDEPFQSVRGAANKERLRSLLLTLVEEAGFQIVLNVDVEAYPEFALGKVVELNDEDH